MSKRRSFSKEQKLQILREAETEGMLATCRKFEIAQSLYYRWKHGRKVLRPIMKFSGWNK